MGNTTGPVMEEVMGAVSGVGAVGVGNGSMTE